VLEFAKETRPRPVEDRFRAPLLTSATLLHMNVVGSAPGVLRATVSSYQGYLATPVGRYGRSSDPGHVAFLSRLGAAVCVCTWSPGPLGGDACLLWMRPPQWMDAVGRVGRVPSMGFRGLLLVDWRILSGPWRLGSGGRILFSLAWPPNRLPAAEQGIGLTSSLLAVRTSRTSGARLATSHTLTSIVITLAKGSFLNISS
jgi:hypothetical protein